MADDYDFQINDLKFRAAVNDQMPYQRATAPFRKEQFDSAPTVGDQSLTGWWTRGQLSFHKGAGLKYYEVLDGETVLNRYLDSTTVDVWTAGEASLPSRLFRRGTGAFVDGAARFSAANNADMAYVIDGTGVVRRINEAGDLTLTSSAASTITASPVTTYITAADKIQQLQGGTVFTDLVTNTVGGGVTFVGVWWAKGRLFSVDSGGRWFTHAPGTVASVAAVDSFWASGISSTVESWAAAETPAAVYLANKSTIYAAIPNADGSTPTLTAPVVAAELPRGEEVKAMFFTLGQLVIVTNAGVRLAETSTQGDLIYGPPIIEFTSTTCRKVGAWGNFAYVTGMTADDATECVYELDLAGAQNLVAPYARRTVQAGTNTGSGVLTLGGLVAHFGADGLYIETGVTLEASGTLTTGYHRFGTLDLKSFHNVTVRAAGTGGSITVATVDADGVVKTLGSIKPSEGAKTFSIEVTAERLALKFTLTRDVDASLAKGPTLLGYQLRAMPLPKRQRLFKWPLVVMDEFNLRTGRRVGKTGRAYTDLTALESLESSNAVITFTDHRTGETGSAYIDSVEFQTDTPPSQTTNGFGGVAYVTLRVLT